MTHSIHLFIGDDGSGRPTWLTRHSDPGVRELFGTDVIPTPYFAETPEAVVLAKLRERNPDHVVTAQSQFN